MRSSGGVLVVLAGLVAVVVGFAASEANAAKLDLKLVRVASGIPNALYLTSAAGEPKRLYVIEQQGRIRVIKNGRLLAAPFLDITHLVSSGGERGLLSVAFHPRYKQNRLFYVNYTDGNGDTRVVEYRKPKGEAPVRVRELLFVEQPYGNHNGGQLAFGKDGRLYTGTGDGGSGGDPGNRAQNLDSRLGKLLRVNVDQPGADWQIVGYGLRNPWRFSFDRKTGALFIGDVGQDAREEIDYTTTPGSGLENYGWNVYEGSLRFRAGDPNPAGRLVFPIRQYSHARGCSVTGGYVYRGSSIPAAKGRYFFGDYCSGTVWSFKVRNGKARGVKRHRFRVGALSSFGESAKGELYLVSLDGEIYRLAKG